jgi:Na+/melibiose symporter-like transporter
VLPEGPANSAIGITNIFGAFTGAVFAVLVGHLSDKTRSRMGRRNPWILGGAITSGIALIGLAVANYSAIWPVVLFFCLFQAGLNTYYASYNALLPDRIHSKLLGRASAYAGFGSLAGTALGSIVTQLLIVVFGTQHITRGFLVLPWSMLIIAVIIVLAIPGANLSNRQIGDIETNKAPAARFRLPKDRDFWLAYVGRFFVVLGIMLILQTATQILRYHYGLDIKGAAAVGTVAGLIMAGVGAVASIFGGVVSDKLDKRKPLIALSVSFVVIGMIVLALTKTLVFYYVYTALAALAFGIFQAVDQALMVEVLPDKENAAQDMGILGTTNTLTGVIAGGLGAALIASLGYELLFISAAVLSIAGILVFIPIRRVK